MAILTAQTSVVSAQAILANTFAFGAVPGFQVVRVVNAGNYFVSNAEPYNPAMVEEILNAAHGPFVNVPQDAKGFIEWINAP